VPSIAGLAIAIVVAGLFQPAGSWAVPGDLDPTFGSGGVVMVSTVNSGRAVAVQPDHKIVVVSDGIQVTRFNPDGTLDAMFGSGGTVTTPIGTGATGAAVALQSDGMIVVAGGSGGHFALARYDTSGTLDPLFGTGGIVLTPIQTSATANAVVVQSTGAIVAAGYTINGGGPPHFALARYTAGGVLDVTFGTAGTVITPISPNSGDIVHALLLGPGDELVAVGESGVGAAAVRYDSGGGLDPTFGVGGVSTSAVEDFYDAMAGAFQPDGKIVLAGISAYLEFRTARITDAGALDTGFGGNGVVATSFGGISGAAAVVVEPDGRVTAAGFDGTPGPGPTGGFAADFVLARYLANGSLDGGFGASGRVRSDFGMSEGIAAGAIDGNTLVVAGSSGSGSPFGADSMIVARYQLGRLCTGPLSGCKAPTVPRRSTLQVRERTTNDQLQWKFRAGDATTLAEFGDPRVSERYVLCVYDESGAEPMTLGEVVVPPGGLCRAKPCWKAVGTRGFGYRDPDRTAYGIGGLTLIAGAAGQSKITLQGKGDPLPTLGLPLNLPVRVQLHASSGACWETVYSAAGVSRNDGTLFKGKSD